MLMYNVDDTKINGLHKGLSSPFKKEEHLHIILPVKINIWSFL